MYVSMLLGSWFIIHPILASRIADVTILCSCKVLKTFNHPLNHMRKFTILTRKILHDHF